MADKTGIEWTDATWNPITGCTKVSAGCDNCYAETFAERWRGTPGHYFEGGFDVQLRPDRLDLPLRWRRPRRIFVNSMSDLFHDQVPDEYIAKVFAVMSVAHQHTFQVLTKRHGRMRSLINSEEFHDQMGWHATKLHPYWSADDAGWPIPNCWLGVSAENQQWADIRIPALLDTPAAVRWVSAEPLLGPLDLSRFLERDEAKYDVPALDWVVAGGESGRAARPMHPDWARSLRDQCEAAGAAFLFKQWGEWRPVAPDVPDNRCTTDCLVPVDGSDAVRIGDVGRGVAAPGGPWTTMRRAGKKAAGRLLDGREHNGYPQAVSHA